MTTDKFKFVLKLSNKNNASIEMSGMVSVTAKDAILKILLENSRECLIDAPDVTQSSPLPPA